MRLVAPKDAEGEDGAEAEATRTKILYYNAFTEDLFSWDNGAEHRLEIKPNRFTHWILVDQGQDRNIIGNFQRYTNDKLTPKFEHESELNDDGPPDVYPFSSVSFSMERGDENSGAKLKISKGEESLFIWSMFYTLLETIVDVLREPEVEVRETDQFDELDYIFIDDPVSSLDDNHLIELAQNLATLIISSPQDGPKFIITTHNALFYNVLHNALNNGEKYRLSSNEDGLFALETQKTDSPFSYHLHLIEKLKAASEQGNFEKYHYNFLRNILEKTATFLGYENWGDLLPKAANGTSAAYLKRIVDISSHSKHSDYELSELSPDDKRVLDFLLRTIANQQFEFAQRYQMEPREDTPNG